MQSPIDDRVFKWAFHGAVFLFSARMLVSLYQQKRAALGCMNEVLRRLRSSSYDDKARALGEVLEALEADLRAKKGTAKLAILKSLRDVADTLKYDVDHPEDCESGIMTALKVLQKVCLDAEGRAAFHQVGGYRKLMGLLAVTHKTGNVRIMEEAAVTLRELTAIDPGDVVLPADVPAGAEGLYSLAGAQSTPKMLRTLDPQSRIVFLSAVAGVFANVTALESGARAVGKGTDGFTGLFYFMRLLEHGNPTVVEYACRSLFHLIEFDPSQHKEVGTPESVQRIVQCMTSSRNPITLLALLSLVREMIRSKDRAPFFTNFCATDGPQQIFMMWVRDTEKSVRDRAEILVHMLSREPECASTFNKLMEHNRSAIQERRSKDHEAMRKQQQQQQQQKMYNQMMMQALASGDLEGLGGMGGEEEDEM